MCICQNWKPDNLDMRNDENGSWPVVQAYYLVSEHKISLLGKGIGKPRWVGASCKKGTHTGQGSEGQSERRINLLFLETKLSAKDTIESNLSMDFPPENPRQWRPLKA